MKPPPALHHLLLLLFHAVLVEAWLPPLHSLYYPPSRSLHEAPARPPPSSPSLSSSSSLSSALLTTRLLATSPSLTETETTTAAGLQEIVAPPSPTSAKVADQPSSSPPHTQGIVPQILAPAGGAEQFLAALNAGADAVYLGLKNFNARARAENFSLKDLEELVPLAHHFGMQVLVTINVVIKEAEMGKLLEDLAALEALEVDAIIVQDQGVGNIVREHFPNLRLHASTQMAVHNLAGVIKASSLGYRRVVLARELTAKELKQIRSRVPREVVELEAFCHGSLCYSYSGLCLFSGANDARSGNRGECSYACRQPFNILNEKGYGFLFSMMDLDTSHDLPLLVESGVDTLKIEGRKRDAQYVSSIVQLYRRQLDAAFGRSTLRPMAPTEAHRTTEIAADAGEDNLRQDLQLSFHRGHTSFFVKGRYHENVIDLNNPGHLGVPIGQVHKVKRQGSRMTITFFTETPLERYDGLRLIPPNRAYHSTPQHGKRDEDPGGLERAQKKYGSLAQTEFSLRDMAMGGKKVFEAPGQSWVDIVLPPDVAHAGIRQGDLVYKTRSNELKRRTESLSVVPREYKLRAWKTVRVVVKVEPRNQDLCLDASVWKLGQEIARETLEVPLEAAQKDPDRLVGDLADILGTFGEQGIRASEVEVQGAVSGYYVGRKDLKGLKARLAEGLPPALDRLVKGRLKAAKRGLGLVAGSVGSLEESVGPLRPVSWEERRFAIKVDRLDYLEVVKDYCLSHRKDDGLSSMALPIREVVFEPKRAYLGDRRASEVVDDLVRFEEETGLSVRLALPAVVRSWDEPPLKAWVMEYRKRCKHPRFEVSNLGGLAMLEEQGSPEYLGSPLEWSTDFTLYSLNSQASAVWAQQGASLITLSVEDDASNVRDHLQRWPVLPSVSRPQAILYQDTPLFMAEACSLTALHGGCPGAKVCGYRTLQIEGPEGERYMVSHEHCKSLVYAEQPYSIIHRQATLLKAGVQDYRLDFLTRPYDRDTMWAVLEGAAEGRPLPNTHMANFDRRLL